MRNLHVVAVLAAFLASSCACWKAEQRNTPACVVVHEVIDCMTPDVQTAVKGVYPLVEFLLDGAGGDPNWESYLVALETMGLQVVACTVQAVTENLVTLAQGLPDAPDYPDAVRATRTNVRDHAARVEIRALAWKAKRLPANTVIKTH